MTPTEYNEALKRLRTKLRQRFPIGCRVKLTRKAAKQWPKYAGATGTVVRHSHSGVSPSVLWDGRKTDDSYHSDFLRRVHS